VRIKLLILTAILASPILVFAQTPTANQCESCSNLGESGCQEALYCTWDDGGGILNRAECHANINTCNQFCWLGANDDPDEINCFSSNPDCEASRDNVVFTSTAGPNAIVWPACGAERDEITRFCATYSDPNSSSGLVEECRFRDAESCTEFCNDQSCTGPCVEEGSEAHEDRASCTQDNFLSTFNSDTNECVNFNDPQYDQKVAAICQGGGACSNQCSTCRTIADSGNPGPGSFTGSGISAAFELDGFKPFENVEGLYVRGGETASIPQFINTFLGFIIGISGAAVVVIIVVSGFQYVTAAAGTSKTASKERVTEALIGLVILLCSVAILNTINPRLLNLDQLEPIPVEITRQEFEGDRTGYGGGRGSSVPGGVGGTTPSTGQVGQFSDLMVSAAQQNNLEYCAVEALISNESSGNPRAISIFGTGPGCRDNACPSETIDPANKDIPRTDHYGYWRSNSERHAIGLVQILIDPKRTWPEQSKPTRREAELSYGGSRSIDIEMLITPNVAIPIGVKYFKWIMDEKAQGDPVVAYAGYNAGPNRSYDELLALSRTGSRVDYREKLELCRRRQNN
jgi:hypothetical protein